MIERVVADFDDMGWSPLATLQPDDALRQAAEFAFALIRFEEGAAHPSRASTPPGMPRIGPDAYLFTPSWRPVLRDEVPTFLTQLASPALLAPTTTRWIV